MRLRTILLYDQTGHSRQYGPCAWHVNQRKAVNTHSEYVIFFFHCKNGWLNVPHNAVIRRLSFVYYVFCS